MHEQRDSETIETAVIVKMAPVVACGDALDLPYVLVEHRHSRGTSRSARSKKDSTHEKATTISLPKQ